MLCSEKRIKSSPYVHRREECPTTPLVPDTSSARCPSLGGSHGDSATSRRPRSCRLSGLSRELPHPCRRHHIGFLQIETCIICLHSLHEVVMTPVVVLPSDIPDRLINIANTNASLLHGISAYAIKTWDGQCESTECNIITM